jgi:nucleoside 2-deoxyribosyltransferase
LQGFDCVAIRIDREAPLGGLVDRIKAEIRRARFVVTDLTDERPSCYFEVGYAEALRKPVIFVASKESVMEPGQPTKIHFDIHQNVQFFSNHEELATKLSDVAQRNREALLDEERLTTGIADFLNTYALSTSATFRAAVEGRSSKHGTGRKSEGAVPALSISGERKVSETGVEGVTPWPDAHGQSCDCSVRIVPMRRVGTRSKQLG